MKKRFCGKPIVLCSLLAVLILVLAAAFITRGRLQHTEEAASAETGMLMGAGNVEVGKSAEENEAYLNAFNACGVTWARVAVMPGRYYPDNRPEAKAADEAILQCYRHGIRPMFLFEYMKKNDGPIGDYNKWFAIGKAFAERFMPGGSFGRENGIPDAWGVTVYEAYNEPDNVYNNDVKPEEYKNALRGFADGVHAADKNLKAIPGGFCAPNAKQDYTCGGYAVALASLWNDGTLDGIDLHTYYDDTYASIGYYERSAQYAFDAVKKECGITRDINFYCTEFMQSDQLQGKSGGITEASAAKKLLTGVWDHFGVVKKDGSTSATQFAMPWYLCKTKEAYADYGLVSRLDPWTPYARAATLKLVNDITEGLHFESLDPKGTGEFVLSGEGKKLWVWQCRSNWTNHKNTEYTCREIPSGSAFLRVYGYDGLRRVIPLKSMQRSYTVTDLPGNETYMFLAAQADTEVRACFDDVPAGYPGKEYIDRCTAAGILAHGVFGEKGPEIHPEAETTRAEAAVMIARALKLKGQKHSGKYKDVRTEDWFTPWVEAVAKAGIMTPAAKDAFLPEEGITLDELAGFINNAYFFMKSNDIPDGVLSGLGIAEGVNDRGYDGKNRAKRMDAAIMVYNMLDYMKNPPITEFNAKGKYELRVCCGSISGSYTDSEGNVWVPCKKYEKGEWGYASRFWEDNTGRDIAGTRDSLLYSSYILEPDGGNIVFKFTVPPGSYEVTLKFADEGFDRPGKRVQDIIINDRVVIPDFDIVKESGGQNTAIDKTVQGIEVTDGLLTVTLRKKAEWPEVSAIQIRQQ